MSDKPHVMIAASMFYPNITEELVRGAEAVLGPAGVTWKRFDVPGAFEIPAAIRMAIRSIEFSIDRRRYDAFVALGCIIRGQTSHYDHIAQETVRALQTLATEYTLAIGMGILTVENEAQAWERARVDHKNKGGEAANTCLAMVETKRRFSLFPRREPA